MDTTRDDEQVMLALRAIMREVDLHSRFLIRHYGLTGPQLIILSRLATFGAMSITQLSHAVNLGQATMTGVLERMEQKNLILREKSSQDKRKVVVRLTDDGRTILEKAPPMLHETFTHRFNELENWERSLIVSCLQRVAVMMERTPPPKPPRPKKSHHSATTR
jgi:DNA-binding MarR family transcriptional regulator